MRLLWGAELRRGWRGLVTLAVIVALVGAVALAALAGARRTSTSFDRFIEDSRNQDVLVFATDVRPADVAKLRTLPGVDAIGYIRAMSVLHKGDFLAAGGALDDSVFHSIARLRIIEGRPVRTGATDEVVVGEALAKRLGLRVGGTLPLQSFTQAQIDAVTAGGDPQPVPAGPDLHLRIVGISRTPVDLSLQGSDGGILLFSRAMVAKYGPEIGNFSGAHGAVVFARLTDGKAGAARFLRQMRTVLGDRGFDVDPAALSVGGVQQSIDLLALAVLVLGLSAGVAGLIALGLIIGRHVASTATRQRPIRDLGVTRARRALAAGGPAAAAVMIGVVGAGVVAWMASPLFPFGVAGDAEPHPGLHFDGIAIGLGALVLVVFLFGTIAGASWHSVRVVARSGRARPSALTRLLGSGRLSPSATIGMRLALEPGRGPTAVPVRSSLLGTGFAVFGVVAVAVFGASLTHLAGDGRAFGHSWDVTISDGRVSAPSANRLCGPVETRVARDPDVAALASVCNLNATIDGRAVGAYAIAPVRGTLEPTVLHGRAPRTPREVALGSETLSELGRGIGDHVIGRTPAGRHRYLVVGEVVVPSLRDPQAIGDGAVFTPAGLNDLDSRDDTLGSTILTARFRDSVDQRAAIARIRAMPGIGTPYDPGVVVAATPLEVDRLGQIDRVPAILAAFLALVGTIAIAHLLVTSGQRRRRDFAVLKSIGFTRGQLARSVAWQATIVACIGCVVGVAVGLVAGTVLWRAVAERVGVLPVVDPAVPILAISVVATFVIANIAAFVPARTAARVKPGVVLRSE